MARQAADRAKQCRPGCDAGRRCVFAALAEPLRESFLSDGTGSDAVSSASAIASASSGRNAKRGICRVAVSPPACGCRVSASQSTSQARDKLPDSELSAGARSDSLSPGKS
jgi:hypothetical protein